MQAIFRVLLRLALLAVGLLFAASLLVGAFLFLLVWVLRVAWGRLTGRPVVPFVMRVDPRAGFNRVFGAYQGGPWAGARGPSPSDSKADVVDVEARQVRD